MSFKLRLCVFSLAICQSYAALASTAVPADPNIDVMTITGDRFDTTPDQQLSVINIIDRAEIERINPKSVVDLLETLPGISVTRSGGAAQTASVSIRGTSAKHALVVVDGIRIGSATLGQVSFSTMSPENIERIEILKGPRAAIWGSDAIGGVIQIFTRKLQDGEWYAATEYGSDAYMRFSAGVGVDHGDGYTSISLNSEQSDGYDVKNDTETDDDGYKRVGLSINGEQTLNQQWQLSWIGQLETGNYEYDSSYANESDFDNYLWSAAAQYINNNYSSKLTFGQSSELSKNAHSTAPNIIKSEFQTTRDQLYWSNRFLASDNLTFIGGVDWTHEAVTGNNYAIDKRDLLGIYGLERYQFDKLLFEAVIRRDNVENVAGETSYNASLAYQLIEQFRLSASSGTGFKAPTFNDLYTPETGNPNLIPETSKNLDVTLKYSADNLQSYISFYQNKIDNLIIWEPSAELDENGYAIWKPANVDKAEIRGVEFAINFTTWQIEHQLGYSYTDAINSKTNEQLVGRSEHEFDYGISYAWSDFDILVNYHYQGKRNAGKDETNKIIDFLDPYHQFNLGLGYQVTNAWLMRLKVNNLLDTKVISNQDYFSPDRQFFLTMSYQNF